MGQKNIRGRKPLSKLYIPSSMKIKLRGAHYTDRDFIKSERNKRRKKGETVAASYKFNINSFRDLAKFKSFIQLLANKKQVIVRVNNKKNLSKKKLFYVYDNFIGESEMILSENFDRIEESYHFLKVNIKLYHNRLIKISYKLDVAVSLERDDNTHVFYSLREIEESEGWRFPNSIDDKLLTKESYKEILNEIQQITKPKVR